MSTEVVNTVGRRKAAVARVYVKAGEGKITINKRTIEEYFPLEILRYVVKQPMLVTETVGNFDVTITLDGGGIKAKLKQLVWVSLVLCVKSIRNIVLS